MISGKLSVIAGITVWFIARTPIALPVIGLALGLSALLRYRKNHQSGLVVGYRRQYTQRCVCADDPDIHLHLITGFM